jgi:hypothetical protein
MSLVYEALQKAEREKERKAGTPPARPNAPAAPARTLPQPTAAPQPTSRNYAGALIVCASLVALGALICVAVIMTRDSLRPPPAPAPTFTPAVLPPPPAAAPATNVPVTTENDSRFKLTGIMITDGSFGAVINGHIVYDGFFVDGATVKKVERDRVTLESNGRQMVLRLF